MIGDAVYAAGATVTFNDRIKFAFHDDGSTHFVAGDGFDVKVAAGTAKYSQLTPAAVNGSQNAAGILLVYANASAGDVTAIALTRGPAAIKLNGITWGAGVSTDPTTLAAQKVTALAQLLALGIVARNDQGY